MEYVETVRGIIQVGEEILFLRKSLDSKNPNALEFPGGKIDYIATEKSTEIEQKKALVKEILEETGIAVSLDQIVPLDLSEKIEFEYQGKTIGRLVHYFLIMLEEKLPVIINQTLNEAGRPEDNHSEYSWLSMVKLSVELQKPNNEFSNNSKNALKKYLQSQKNR